ncbi:MAG TPA: hypothetical protein PLZ24_09625 [Flavobacteriales bacterium]|jgi:hypothetical protein|nr:hypothetical protein [Flavobacteriales bacterium]
MDTDEHGSKSHINGSSFATYQHKITSDESLFEALLKGEFSGFFEDFDRSRFLNGLHRKMENLGTAGTTADREKRKANFRG